VGAIEKQDARPDTDGELVLSVEIMVETGEEQLLDSRFSDFVVAKRIRHGMAGLYQCRMPNAECGKYRLR
jgi:hypothetical protein